MFLLALVAIAAIEWLSGGRGTPYHQLYLLSVIYTATVHPPRRVAVYLLAFVVAVSAVQTELSEIVRCVDRDILQPLVRLNFGCEARYEIRPLPLMDAYTEKIAPPA